MVVVVTRGTFGFFDGGRRTQRHRRGIDALAIRLLVFFDARHGLFTRLNEVRLQDEKRSD